MCCLSPFRATLVSVIATVLIKVPLTSHLLPTMSQSVSEDIQNMGCKQYPLKEMNLINNNTLKIKTFFLCKLHLHEVY